MYNIKKVGRKSHSFKLIEIDISIMTTNYSNGHNGHNGHNDPKQPSSITPQASYNFGVGLIAISVAASLGIIVSLLFSNLLSKEIAELLLQQSICIANVGQHLVQKESEKKE